jgi:hypothetical protein
MIGPMRLVSAAANQVPDGLGIGSVTASHLASPIQFVNSLDNGLTAKARRDICDFGEAVYS